MQSRDGQGPCNPPFQHVSRVAATNDGTLNAIVNKSVCSVDVPRGHAASHHEDEMLSWLNYPAADSLDRGYCSDLFGDLANSSTQLVRHSCNELGLRSHTAPFNTGTSLLSSILSHCAPASINTCTVASESARDAAESCGSRCVEASFRVAGADAVLGLGACQAAGLTSSCVESHCDKLDLEGEVLRRPGHAERLTCNSSSANETPCTQSESSQSLSQVSSQHECSLSSMSALSCVPKPLDAMNRYVSLMPTEKQRATNFGLFSRPAVESKVSLHVLGGSSGPTNVERVRQQTGQHVMFQDLTSTCTVQSNPGAVRAKLLPPPAPLRVLLPSPQLLPLLLPPPCDSSVALERSTLIDARQSPALPLAQSSIGESRDEINLSKGTITCPRMSIMSTEKGTRMADQTTTSPSRCSGSSTERSGKVIENMSTKMRLGAGDDSDYLSEGEEMVATDRKSPATAKRLRTAEMHNQSERKRRVKINDKLKTLQQLIPNGNKPDKASLLDAVIEYIKLLQSQLQMISMRTGIGVPSWMIPNVNVQHLQMPSFTQMRLTTDIGMGVGLGMGMRMGVGTMDANVAPAVTGCTIMPMPLLPGPPPIPHSASLQPADYMHSPGMMNLYAGPPHVQHPLTRQHSAMYNTLQQQPQPHMQPQQQHFRTQFKQTSQLPGNAGKRPFC